MSSYEALAALREAIAVEAQYIATLTKPMDVLLAEWKALAEDTLGCPCEVTWDGATGTLGIRPSPPADVVTITVSRAPLDAES